MKPRGVILLLAALALAAKLYCAATTFGTADVNLFWEFGRIIQSHGLIHMYLATALFNHTPLMGWFAAFCHWLATEGGDGSAFNFYLRLPAIFADFGTVLTLVWLKQKTGKPAWWAIGLLAVSPVSFMVSGFHGNVDPLMVFCLALAAAACVAERPVWCGVFLAASCNVKVVPIFLVPAFLFYWWHRGRVVRFSLPAAGLMLAGWSLPLCSIPIVFLKDVFGYSSYWGMWGVTYGLRLTNHPALREMGFTDASATHQIIAQILKAIVVIAVLAVAWRRRKVEPLGIFTTLALSWTIFFVLAPGFGAQYLVWLAPFYLVAAEGWYAALTIASTIGLTVYYTASCNGAIPWNFAQNPNRGIATSSPWLVLTWLVLVLFLAKTVRDLLSRTPPEAETESLVEPAIEA